MNYEKQALDFLKETSTEFKAEFLKHGKHFDSDKDKRDIYRITLKRGDREYFFNFGQSIQASGEYKVKSHYGRNILKCECFNLIPMKDGTKKISFTLAKMGVSNLGSNGLQRPLDYDKNKHHSAPTPYSILACVQKYDVGTFEDFCSEFGYDTDSKKAEKTYKAVCDEYQNMAMLFSDSELEKMSEIQ